MLAGANVPQGDRRARENGLVLQRFGGADGFQARVGGALPITLAPQHHANRLLRLAHAVRIPHPDGHLPLLFQRSQRPGMIAAAPVDLTRDAQRAGLTALIPRGPEGALRLFQPAQRRVVIPQQVQHIGQRAFGARRQRRVVQRQRRGQRLADGGFCLRPLPGGDPHLAQRQHHPARLRPGQAGAELALQQVLVKPRGLSVGVDAFGHGSGPQVKADGGL